MWMDKISWDRTISVTLQEHYGRLRQQLKELEDIKLSRRVFLAQTTKDIQLHVFYDASTTAHAAVMYMRQETSEGTTYVKMLTTKTRVAPIKCICVPRMELCAALLGSKLVETTLAAISDKRFIIPTVFAWTDSQVKIASLREFHRKWKTFVANRVAKIQEILPAEKWKFVPTKDNPADCASRGIPSSALAYHELRWNGPTWLSQSSDNWPRAELMPAETTQQETRIIEDSGSVTMVTVEKDNRVLDLLTRFSRLSKIVRILSYVKRFVKNCTTHHWLDF